MCCTGGLNSAYKSEYFIEEDETIYFTIKNNGLNNTEFISLSFMLEKLPLSSFDMFIKIRKEKNELEEDSIFSKSCIIYKEIDDSRITYDLYHKSKNVHIHIYSNTNLDEILKQICP